MLDFELPLYKYIKEMKRLKNKSPESWIEKSNAN